MKEKFQPLKKVQLRGGFSDRNGINKLNTEIQLTNFDERTRTAILNALNYVYATINKLSQNNYYTHREKLWICFYLDIVSNVYCEEVKDSSYYDLDRLQPAVDEYIRSTILSDSYDSVLTLVEYILNWTSENFGNRNPLIDYNDYTQDTPTSGHYRQYCFDEKQYMNDVFEKEFVGYRFVGEHIVAITDDIEIKEIEQSLDIKFKGCKKHIQKALSFLSDRDKPDYKNSIKESISAVESICIIIAGEGATLGDALKILGKKQKINNQLKVAFEKLYSYTNSEGGIRHAEGLFESDVSFEEAKFMLVSCCAFVNYMIAEYGKIED